MIRALACLVLIAAPASAQMIAPDFHVDAIPTGVISCDANGAVTTCVTALEQRAAFCMAVDAEGWPVANATSVSATGVVTFQDVDASRIAGLRCRPVGG